MTSTQNTSARRIALTVLDSFNTDRTDAADILHSVINKTDQRAQATDITFGTIRNRPLIDHIITTIAGISQKATKPALLNILRIGTYELVFCPDTAHYAIVNEAVKLAASCGAKKQTGFVNAVLRNILRAIDTRKTHLSDAVPARTIPQSTETGCLFKSDILPDPKADLSKYLTQAFSIPIFLIAEWLTEFGPETTQQICFAQNRKPCTYLRPNPLKAIPQTFIKTLASADIEVQTLPDSDLLKLLSHLPITSIPGFSNGLFTVQDPTAAKVAKFIDPKPGQTILDLCSAPGGKTTHIAELIQNTGTIRATDINPDRLKKVDENCNRLNINIVKTVTFDSLDQQIADMAPIDTILLDVPCSNTGVLARRVEARLRITPKAIRDLVGIQHSILKRAAEIIKPGSTICYSTCSISTSENRSLIDTFLKNDNRFTIIKDELTLPATAPFDHDGGYIALLKKTS